MFNSILASAQRTQVNLPTCPALLLPLQSLLSSLFHWCLFISLKSKDWCARGLGPLGFSSPAVLIPLEILSNAMALYTIYRLKTPKCMCPQPGPLLRTPDLISHPDHGNLSNLTHAKPPWHFPQTCFLHVARCLSKWKPHPSSSWGHSWFLFSYVTLSSIDPVICNFKISPTSDHISPPPSILPWSNLSSTFNSHLDYRNISNLVPRFSSCPTFTLFSNSWQSNLDKSCQIISFLCIKPSLTEQSHLTLNKTKSW